MPSYLSNQFNPQQQAMDNKMSRKKAGLFGNPWEALPKPFARKDFTGQFGTNQNYAGSGGVNYAQTPPRTPTQTQPRTQSGVASNMTPTASTQSGLVQKPPIASSTTQNITPASAARSVYKAGEMTDWEKAAAQNAANAAGLKNYGQFAPTAEARFYGVGGQSGGNLPDITLPDLAGRGAPDQGLFNKFANLYGTQANIGLEAAQNAAQRGLTGATSVLGAATPQAFPYSSNVINPLTGESLGSGAAGQGGAFYGGVQGGLGQLGGQYAQNFSAHQQAQGIKQAIGDLVTNNPLNPSDFTSVNQFVQLLNGQIGNPKYQSLSNYLNEYISTLAPILGVGGDTTNLKTQIAQSMINAQASGQNIMSVLNDLDSLAQTKLNQALSVGSGSSGGQTGGGTANAGGYNFVQDANGNWVLAH